MATKLFYVIFFFSTLYLSYDGVAKRIGQLSIIFLIFFTFLIAIRRYCLNKKEVYSGIKFLLPFLFMVGLNFLSLFTVKNDILGLKVILFMLVILVFYTGKISIGNKYIKHKNTIIVLTTLFIIGNIFLNKGTEYFSGSFVSKNGFGAIGIIVIYIILNIIVEEKKSKYRIICFIVTIVVIVLIYLSHARGAWISLIMTLVTFLLWEKVLIVSRKVYISYFNVFIIAAILFPLFYLFVFVTVLQTDSDVSYVNSVTGGNLFSGREVIWGYLVFEISKKPILGHGVSSRPEEFVTSISEETLNEEHYSAHNLYIQTLLQSGLVGLAFLGFGLSRIWKSFFYLSHLPQTKIVASFFVGALALQCFEVSLTQNNIMLGLTHWLIIADGYSMNKKH